MNNEATAEGSTEAVKLPANVCLVASRFFFSYDEKYGEFRKRIHSRNPRYGELRGIVNDPQAGVPEGPAGNPHGRILQAWDAYDTDFRPKGYTLVTVCGGYNGGGPDRKWCEYLGEISGSVQRLVDAFGGAWLVDLREHSDVWYATLGFEDRRSDRAPCFGDDALAYGRYRDTAVAEKRPFGLVDWGHRSYDWAWAKLGGPYSFPGTAFHGSLIAPANVANHYAAYDADARCFRDAFGVYESEARQAFYAVTGTKEALDDLEAEDIRDIGRAAPQYLLEDWRPRPKAEDSVAG